LKRNIVDLSGTSTSDAQSSSDNSVFDDNVDAVGQPGVKSSGTVNGGKPPSSDPAPPEPPPRRPAMSQPGYGDIWQRHAVRPATVGVHRRVLAVGSAADPLSTPKSCPSSPLLDNAGLPRRVGIGSPGRSAIVNGRRTHPPPMPNTSDAVGASSCTSPPVPRRTKLRLSPPDVR